MGEVILVVILFSIAGFGVVLLNSDFWKPFRNAKFMDMLQEEQREQRVHAADAEDQDNGTGKEVQNIL